MNKNDEFEIVKVEAQPMQLLAGAGALERANIDIQVSTAHAYPRSLTRCEQNAIAIVTGDSETAMACSYSLPRGGRPICGPSVHLAKILAQQYGNIRAEARVVDITDKQIVSRGTAWDLENNYAVAYEVRRSILNASGKRYTDDMITVTGNAANSIAYRNAVFAVIPQALTRKVLRAAEATVTGGLSDEQNLIKRRQGAVQYFADNYGITEEEVAKLCGRYTIQQIKAPELATLIAIMQSLNDGDTTVDDLLAPIRNSKEAKGNKLTDIANKSAQNRTNNAQ